jgi:hypothetical protein
MQRFLALSLAFTMAAPVGLAGPVAKPKKLGKPPEYFIARRQAQIDRKAALKARVQEHKAARAAAEEKVYQDWHERYVADAPVLEQYFRTQESAYQAHAASMYAAGPPTIIQMSQSVGPTGSPFGSTFTPSCSTTRSAFFGQAGWGW